MARRPKKSLAQQATTVPFLVGKPLAGGVVGWYWEPSPKLRKAGWKSKPLGTDHAAAIEAAKARNLEVEAWAAGGARPAEVAKIIAPHTFDALLARFEAEEMDDDARRRDMREPLAASTKREYRSYAGLLRRWAEDGNTPIAAITEDRIKVLKTALFSAVNPRTGEVKRYRAVSALRHLSMLMAFAKAKKLIAVDPMENITIPQPGKRKVIIRPAAITAIRASAIKLGRPDVEIGVLLGLWTLQREGDVLAYNRHKWRECKDMSEESRRILAGVDGKVMGFHFKPEKTKNSSGIWLEIPALPELRTRIEEAFADNAARTPALTCLVADPDEARPTPQWKFQRGFRAAVNDALAKAVEAEDEELAEQLTGIQFRDLRRTGMCLMRELGLSVAYIASISGHTIEETSKILETYMPPDAATNAAAIAMLATRLEERKKAEQKEQRA